ncbi:MAG: hypothetical protein R3F43_31335 [bacterium]
MLLLDEPTNHLDLPTIGWLEKFLEGFRGALLIISHDRAFLGRLAKGMLWLDRGRLHRRDEPFDRFETWAEQLALDEESRLNRLDKKLAEELHWLAGRDARRSNMGRPPGASAPDGPSHRRPSPRGPSDGRGPRDARGAGIRFAAPLLSPCCAWRP